jgi:hypothetical protein
METQQEEEHSSIPLVSYYLIYNTTTAVWHSRFFGKDGIDTPHLPREGRFHMSLRGD